jgi:non-specific serine/threonine protein kinase
MDSGETFGERVRRRRRALDLTQAALARRAGCAAITIQKIEAGERRPSRQVAELLAAALEVPAGERADFVRRARGEAPRSAPPERATAAEGGLPHNLPAAPNAFVGRQEALAHVEVLLERARLVTLTGPGGTGKTRLALQVARQALAGFADGVWFVPLASLRAPEQVGLAVADALGLRTVDKAGPAAALKRSLGPKRLLLVLDNFEHLLGAAALMGELLAAAPGVKILATSREALGVYGEQVYAVPPLAVPTAHRPELWPALGQVEAVALFVQRAMAAEPGFALDAENAGSVAEICLRLEGLPLALELAAARARVFTPAELLKRLEARLPMLTGGPRDAPQRQQTLRDTIAWSEQLLPENERALFARLAVFAGGFDLEAAEAIAGSRQPVVSSWHARRALEAGGGQQARAAWSESGHQAAHKASKGQPPEDRGQRATGMQGGEQQQDEGAGQSWVMEGVAALVHKSLVQREVDSAGQSRFRLLEVVREYAGERWKEDGFRYRHLEYYRALAERGAQEILGAGQAEWLERLAREHANFEAALAWSQESGAAEAAEAGLRLAGALGWYWHFRGHWTEGRRWLRALLAWEGGEPQARALALCAAGLLAWAQDDFAEAKARLGAGLALLSAGQANWTRAHAQGILGLVLLYEENLEAAEPLFEEGLKLFRGLEDPFGIGLSLIRVGLVARLRGDFARAAAASAESLALYEALDNPWGTATASANLGEIALDQDAWQVAAGHYRRALKAMRPTGSQWYTGLGLVGVAGVAALRGEARAAARLLGVAEALVSSVEGKVPAMDRRLMSRYVVLAQTALGEPEYEAARAEGAAAGPAVWDVWVEEALRA